MTKHKRHAAEFMAKVALEAIRGDLTTAEPSKRDPVNAIGPNEPANAVPPATINGWKRTAMHPSAQLNSGIASLRELSSNAPKLCRQTLCGQRACALPSRGQ